MTAELSAVENATVSGMTMNTYIVAVHGSFESIKE
jgi:hypothetical protein